MILTPSKFQQATLLPLDRAEAWTKPLINVFQKFDLSTPIRQAAFIAQCGHESDGFRVLVENLNYSADGLHSVFKKYFPTIDETAAYARQPEKIANKVYADRLGNDSEESGDGWKFRGRGLIQITGKDSYRAFGVAVGQDFLSNPDLVAQPIWAAESAGWFWNAHHLNAIADSEDTRLLTYKINGGFNGLEDRVRRYGMARSVLVA